MIISIKNNVRVYVHEYTFTIKKIPFVMMISVEKIVYIMQKNCTAFWMTNDSEDMHFV